MSPPETQSTERTEVAIANLLRVGVNTSLVFVTVGTVLGFLQGAGYGGTAADVHRLTGAEGSFPRTFAWFFGGLAHLRGQAVIVAGLLILIATPVVRVAVSLVSFVRQRDLAYVAITGTVLGLLLLTLVLGRAG